MTPRDSMPDAILEADGADGVAEAFLELPRLVYRDDPLWIPEDEAFVRASFSATNPWYATGRARTFCIPGASRVAAFRAPEMHAAGRPAAYFGFWESAGRIAADARILRAAEAWARRHGAAVLYGPIDFNTHGRYRVRVSAEPGAVTFPGEPYNPPEYPERLRALGFIPVEEYVTQVLPTLASRRESKRERLTAVTDRGYRIEPLAPQHWLDRLPQLYRLVDAVFGENLGYARPSYAAFVSTYGSAMLERACPHTSQVAYAPSDEIAGFVMTMPHYGPLVVQGAGSGRVPVRSLSFERHFPLLRETPPVQGIVKTLGVHPRHRGIGLMDALLVAMLDRAEGLYDTWLGALIRADNASRRFGGPVTIAERKYLLFGKELAP